jgi:hypothetical protein
MYYIISEKSSPVAMFVFFAAVAGARRITFYLPFCPQYIQQIGTVLEYLDPVFSYALPSPDIALALISCYRGTIAVYCPCVL